MSLQMASATGRTITHYEILEKLGEGGMGVVYKARDTRLDRLVAIKVLASRFADSAFARKRLIQEARAIAALNHPHIAVLHEIDEFDGETFLVFEHLPGGSLRTRPPHTLAEALEYAVQLTEALGAAHRQGVIHRDIKPSNILFTEDDVLKLTDFGLARHATDPHLTVAGAMVGTPAYMAPEQFDGVEADARSDVYSLGVVVHELVSGKPPQPGHNLNAPAHLKPVIERALEAEPGRRYPNAGEMASHLRAAIARQDLATQAVTLTLERPRPRRALWGLAVVAALAGLLVNHAPVGTEAQPPAAQLAVLPFTNAGDAGWQAFCDGFSETLSGTLTRLEQRQGTVRIIPASVVRSQSIASASDAHRMLGARRVVTGSVKPEANRVRLTLSVLDAQTARPVSVDTASFASEELPSLQDWAVAQVARRLGSPPRPDGSGALADYGTHEPGAYEYYVQGRGYLAHYDVPEDLANAVASFHKALLRDPRYALAHAGMAEALWRTWRDTRDPQWLEEAGASALRARQINDRLAPVHIIAGRIESSRGRYPEAVRDFESALEAEPLNAEAYGALAAAYQSMGNPRQAEASYRKVVELRPGEWSGYNNLAAFYLERGRFPDAEKLLQQMIALAPDNVTGFQNLGGLYLLTARYAEAQAALERSLALKPRPEAYSNLGTAYYYEGRYGDAVSAMEKAVERRPADYVLWGNLGDAYRWAAGKEARAPEAWSRAAALANQQLAVNPRDTRALSSLAVYQAHLGRRSTALAQMARARRLGDANPGLLVKAARVYELCGRREQALGALLAALEAGESPENGRRDPEFAALRRDPACAHVLPKEICR